MAKLIFIGSDRNIFQEGSAVRSRMVEYGTLFDELHVIVNTRGFKKQERLSGNVVAYPTGSVSRWLYPSDSAKIATNIIATDPLGEWVVSAQDPFENGRAALKVCQKTGAKLHVQVHVDFLSPFFRKESLLNTLRLLIARKVLAAGDGIRVVSPRIKESIISNGRYKLKAEPAVLPIYSEFNGQADPFSFKTIHPEWNFVILMVGRIEPEKNYPLALRALAEVTRRYPKVGLAVIGGGRKMQSVRRMAKTLDLDKNVIFLGPISDPAPYYKGADLYLHTANYEGYGLTLTEAALSGLPIISTDVGSIGWLFKQGETALVCEPQNAACLSKALLRMIEDSGFAERLRIGARSSLLEQLPKDRAEYLKMYKNNLLSCLKV
ncbi:MAG: glycosyltransferase [Candidatus Taylorbacteria bacterium]|nr:glycosyltransferase [Candidatus Taylorbacteria bacterium]